MYQVSHTSNDQFYRNIPDGIHGSSRSRNDNCHVYDYDVLHDGGLKMDEDQMKLRQQVLMILFRQFGEGKYSNQSIYECADEWIAKGHKISAGVVKYYEAYYSRKAVA